MIFVAVESGDPAERATIENHGVIATIKRLFAAGIFVASFFEETIYTEHHRAV
ncbi:hypothetical protein NSMS1_61040 (plasmid) [Nostoc sp. MS1]|nr:hypothetical protein NSMS1_61040 [Nostoc sp. MS1]